jgi:hypothetical protein
MNQHPRHQDYYTVEYSENKARENVQSYIGYRVCFGTRGIVLCKSTVSREFRMLVVG